MIIMIVLLYLIVTLYDDHDTITIGILYDNHDRVTVC